jgi:hypothetical protein
VRRWRKEVALVYDMVGRMVGHPAAILEYFDLPFQLNFIPSSYWQTPHNFARDVKRHKLPSTKRGWR